jgi:hypothetical protein
LEFDASNQLIGSLQDFATGAEGPVAFRVGPEGRIYYAAINSGRIYRIDPPLSTPLPPTAQFYTVTPCRVLDTRATPGPFGGPALTGNSTRTFSIAGQCGIPPTATSVAVNLTVTQPSLAGDLRLFPGSNPIPGSSTMNFGPGQTRANNAVLLLNQFGEISVRCVMPAAGTAQFVLNVTGFFQ